jgi:flagellar assembly protein FliH
MLKTRTPRFLIQTVEGKGEPTPASFSVVKDESSPNAETISPHLMPSPGPILPPPPAAPAPPVANAKPAIDAQIQAQLERLSHTVERLRLQSEWLAEQARSDALEIGFEVARRILELEVSVNPEPLFALIRSAIHRVGESRKLSIKLCPTDLAHIQQAGPSARLASFSMAQIELLAAPELSPGDCIIEGELGVVDGRLTARLAELRRAVGAPVQGSAA